MHFKLSVKKVKFMAINFRGRVNVKHILWKHRFCDFIRIPKKFLPLLKITTNQHISSLRRRRHRTSRPDVLLGKGVLKICCKSTGERACQSVILINLQRNFIEITLRHMCSPVSLMHIFRTPVDGCP